MKIVIFSAFWVAVDQITKALVRTFMTLYESIPIIPNFFHLTFITNDGMAFGINIPGGIYIFSLISLIFTIFLSRYLWQIREQAFIHRLGIGFILGGAIGNLIDRFMYREVTDFLDFMIGSYHWYIFNFADTYVTIGMIFVIYDSIISKRKQLIIIDSK